MRQMAKYIKHAKCGLDSLPLYSSSFSHPAYTTRYGSELQMNPTIDLKAKLVFHMLESMIGESTLQKICMKVLEDVLLSSHIGCTE